MTNSISRFSGGGLVYTPAMMQFDGSTGYYSEATGVTAGNVETLVFSFIHSAKAGSSVRRLLSCVPGGSGSDERFLVQIGDTSVASAGLEDRIEVIVKNSAGTVVCRLASNIDVADGASHTLFFEYNGSSGTAQFVLDGQVDAFNASYANHVAPVTGTLSTGASTFTVGASIAGASPTNGQIGYFGIRDIGGLTWSDFMQADGTPKELDTIGWTEWNAGVSQTPMMTFDGSTGYYNKTGITTSGNKVTAVGRFSRATFSGDVLENLFAYLGPTYARMGMIIISSDYTTLPNRRGKVQFDVQNSAGATIAKVISSSTFLDGAEHTFFAQFDAGTGTFTLIIDGVDEDDTGNADRVAPTTGTLHSGAASQFAVCASTAGVSPFEGDFGFCGIADAGGQTWQDFMQADGSPKEIDEIAWSQWGAQPLFWNKGGLMTDNKGSAGAMTKNGTITGPSGGWPLFWNHHGEMSNNLGSAGAMTKNGTIVVGDGGNGPHPLLGLNTVGTAATHHIKTAKTSWVDGVQLAGNAYTPAMMNFDGSTGYYSDTFTRSGNKVTVVIRFKLSSFTGGTQHHLFHVVGSAGTGRTAMSGVVGASDYATPEFRSKVQIYCANTANTAICNLVSSMVVADGEAHTLFASFDGDTGAATFYIDGADADDTGFASRVLTTGSLQTGSSSVFSVAGSWTGANLKPVDIGFCGHREAYLTNLGDFMQADGSPKQLDESGWTEWGAQPLFWNESGDMVNNLGSAGAMTKNGTINVGKGGNG